MRTDSHFTKEYLQSLFEYKDGELYWRETTRGKRQAGAKAGTRSHHYFQICIDHKLYRTHRLVWAYHNGPTPHQIDHINGDAFDNRIENLRECTLSQNQYNRKIAKQNKSGVKGIGWCKQKQKWRGRMIVDGKEHHIGFFDSIEDAEKAVQEKRALLHGIFARHA
jgi:HNH endonuclease